jgi:hypothetical protein
MICRQRRRRRMLMLNDTSNMQQAIIIDNQNQMYTIYNQQPSIVTPMCMLCQRNGSDYLSVCNHTYHRDCLRTYFYVNPQYCNSCPSCQSYIVINWMFDLHSLSIII